jgi:hypothetical protein
LPIAKSMVFRGARGISSRFRVPPELVGSGTRVPPHGKPRDGLEPAARFDALRTLVATSGIDLSDHRMSPLTICASTSRATAQGVRWRGPKALPTR